MLTTKKPPSRLTPLDQPSTKSLTRSSSQKSFGAKSNGSNGTRATNGEDFKPLNVLIFKNGDEYDPGLEMSITRKQYHNWLHLLDYLTNKLKLTEGAVHKIYAYPSGMEVRHFTEMESAGKFFVAAHAKYKKVKYGKHPRMPNFSTHPSALTPRYEPPKLNSSDSLQLYLKSHGFKPELGDIWQDEDFNMLKKRNKAKSEENILDTEKENFNEETSSQYQAPQRSKSEFGGDGLDWGKEPSQFGSVLQQQAYDTEEREENENSPFRHVIGQRSQSVSSFQFNNNASSAFKEKAASDYGGTMANYNNYESRRESVGGFNFDNRSIFNQDQKEAERERTLTLIKKKNMKLQTEPQPAEEEIQKSAILSKLNTSEQSTNNGIDDARYDFMKKEKSFINDYWRDREERTKRDSEKPPPIKTRSTSVAAIDYRNWQKNTSLDRSTRLPTTSYNSTKPASDSGFRPYRSENRTMTRLPRNLSNSDAGFDRSYGKNRRSKNESDSSPQWAQDLTYAVRQLSERVDQLSARSNRAQEGLFDED